MTNRTTWLRSLGLALLLVLSALLAACGSSQSGDSDDTGDAITSSGADTNIAALRPDVPAPIDSDFRDDPAALVGATGNPQFLEFYAVW